MTEKRGRGARSLAAVLPKVAEPAMRKRGFAAVEIVTGWPSIVGAALAAETTPERLSFPPGKRLDGTLHVRTSGPLALEIQHLEPVILDRINTYFGYRAVARLKLAQGPRPARPKAPARKAPRAPNPARRAAVEQRTQGIDDTALRDALNKLGEAVDSTADPESSKANPR
ncbi:MAG: DciA family protein [Alphaproteobacteria bacterium]